MQVPTYPDGRSADLRSGRRSPRPIELRAPSGPSRASARNRSIAVAVVAVVLALAVACTLPGSDDAAEPDDLGGIQIGPTTAPEAAPTTVVDSAAMTLPPGFVLPDTRAVVLPPVLGRPKPEPDRTVPVLPMRGGKATLRGTVFGPDGPVGGAVVRLERFVGEDFGREDLSTNADGEWQASGMIGGRYRIRAWVRPDLATIEPQAVFVSNEEGDATVDLTVERFDGEQIQGALEVATPAVGEVHPLRVLVSRIEVTEDGIVGGVGIEGREVELRLLGGIRVVGQPKGTTDGEGYVVFSVVCTVVGVHGVTVASGELTADVELPDCAEGVFDPSVLPPEVSDFPVGSTFDVPSAGPYPAGTYVATTPGTCGTAFELLVGGEWIATNTRTRTLVLPNQIRNVKAVPGAPVCSFRRTA